MNDYEDEDCDWGRKFTEQEIECCRMWFEFLKLSDRQKWSEDVAHYFGDISCEFDEWWPKHQYLFRKLKPFIIDEVITDDDFQSCKDSLPSEGDLGIVTIALHMYATKQQLRDAFEEILLKYHRGNSGRPEFDGYGDYFSFHARPDEVMLNKILAVYRVYSAEQNKPKKDQRPLWEIEDEVSKTTLLIDKTSDRAAYNWKTNNPDKSIESIRRSQLTTVRKYINYAEEILTNVVVGRFPVYTVGKSKAKN